MISFLRSLINSKVGAFIALAFVGLLGLAFALGDVTGSGSFGGLSGGNVAKVGSRNITLSEFQSALENRLRGERKNNPTLDMANFVEAGGLESTLQQLINRYALAEFGEQYGVSVGKRLVDSEILKIPGAKGLDGKFSEEAFRNFVAQIGVSEQMVRDDIRQNLFAEQMFPTAAAGPQAPKSMVLPYASLLLEKRSGDLAIIPSAAFLPQSPPTDVELNKYYKANVARFTIPEQRAISYAVFERSILGDRVKPTESDIASYYKKNPEKYLGSEVRDITQMIVPTEAAAKSVLDKASAGKSLDAVAAELGLSAGKTAGVTKDKLSKSTSAAVADAVFAAAKGALAKPARGGLGWYVVRVTDARTIATKSLEQATPEITAILGKTKAEEALADFTAEMEDAFADGSSLADVAKANNLTVQKTAKLLGNGQDPANPNYRPDDVIKAILTPGFQMEQDGDPQLIELVPGEKFAIIAVADLQEAAPPPLAKVKPLVQQQWALSQGKIKAKAAAEQVQKAVNAGKPLSAAIAALGVRLPSPQSVSGARSELNQQGKPLSPPIALLFAMKKGTTKTLPAPQEQGWFVVYLKDVIKGDASKNTAELDARRAEMTQLIRDEYAAQLIAAAAKNVGVTRNESVIKDLRTRLTTRNDGK
jgi:peptidyl-prolyl cis-trans isomerase D